MVRGQKIYYTDGELAFDMVINTKKDVGTHVGVYLEQMEDSDALGGTYHKILNSNGRVQVVQDSLVSEFNY